LNGYASAKRLGQALLLFYSTARLSLTEGNVVMRLSEALEIFYLSMDGVVSPATIKFYENRLPSLIKHLGDKEISEVSLPSVSIIMRQLTPII